MMFEFVKTRLDSVLRFVVFVVFFGFVGYLFAAALMVLDGDIDFSMTGLMGDGSLFLVSIGLAATALAEAIGFEDDQKAKLTIVGAALIIVTVSPFGFAVAQIFNGDESADEVRLALVAHRAAVEEYEAVAGPSRGGVDDQIDSTAPLEVLSNEQLRDLNNELFSANKQMANALEPGLDSQAWIFAVSSAIVTLMALGCAFATWITKPE